MFCALYTCNVPQIFKKETKRGLFSSNKVTKRRPLFYKKETTMNFFAIDFKCPTQYQYVHETSILHIGKCGITTEFQARHVLLN